MNTSELSKTVLQCPLGQKQASGNVSKNRFYGSMSMYMSICIHNRKK